MTENENGRSGGGELSDVAAEDANEEQTFRPWSYVPPETEKGGLCRHDMVPEWCAFCSPPETKIT